MRTYGLLCGALLTYGASVGCGDDSDELDYRQSCPAGDEAPSCQVFELVNRERAQASLAPYVWNAELAEAAQSHCEDMVANDYFDHVGEDGSTFDERAAAAGYTGAASGENIAQGATTAEGVMSLWMDSDGHRANILSERSTEMGVGFCGGSTWVQVFGAGRG